MTTELNYKLKNELHKNLAEYMPTCKESLVRNMHMHTFKEVELWYPTAEGLEALETVIGYVIDIFVHSYKGDDRLGNVLGSLVEVARKQRAYTAHAHDRELWDAAVVDFLNFWAGKHGMDLGLYAKDLLPEPLPRSPHMQLIELMTGENDLNYVATVEIPILKPPPAVVLWGNRFFRRLDRQQKNVNGNYYANKPDQYAECFAYASLTESPGLPRWEPPAPPPVDRTAVDVVGKAVAPGEPDITPEPDGQQAGYVVLNAAERAKGFVRPVRDTYRHVGSLGPKFELRDLTPEESARYPDYAKYEPYPDGYKGSVMGRFWTQAQLDAVGKGCGKTTTMGREIAETYARDPSHYGSTFCVTCKKHFPVGEDGEFVWVDDETQRVGT